MLVFIHQDNNKGLLKASQWLPIDLNFYMQYGKCKESTSFIDAQFVK